METELINDLEDGEIEDNETDSVDDVYSPLERPQLNPTHIQPVITEPSDHEEPSSDSSSDSDNSSGLRHSASRQKKKPMQHKLRNSVSESPKRKKYNIWCTDATEEVLTNNLINCNVDKNIDRSRDVESYDHLLAYSHLKEVNKVMQSSSIHSRLGDRTGPSNKRNSSGHCMASSRKKLSNIPKPDTEMTCRAILPLVKSAEDTAKDLAEDIANKLLEEKECVISNVIEVLGKQRAIDLFEETAQIERNGGLLIMNGARRRTPGGVYFFLLKSLPDILPEQISKIFGDDRRKHSREIKKSKAAKRKEAISKEDYPTLLCKAEAAILKMKEEAREAEDGGEEVKNPPPSPATDGRDNSSDGDEPKTEIILGSSPSRFSDTMDI